MPRILLLLFCLFSLNTQTKPPLRPVTPYATTYVYDVDLDYPNFVVAGLAFFGGLIGTVEKPDHIYYKEHVFCDTSKECFELTIRTDEQKTWLFVIGSDTSSGRSFSDLPRNDKFFLSPDAIDFIVRLRSFLSDSLGIMFRDTFFYDDQYLTAYVVQRNDLRNENIRYVDVSTAQRDSLKEPYLDAQIKIYESDQEFYYSSINVHLKDKDVRITLSLSNIVPSQ